MLLTKENSQKNHKKILDSLFASGSRVALLRIFLLDPTRAHYQRQLEVVTGMALRALQRELERLTDIGLLHKWNEGNRVYYQIDPDFLLYPELRSLMLKCSNNLERLRATLATEPAIRLAFYNIVTETCLAIVADNSEPTLPVFPPITLEFMQVTSFRKSIRENAETLAPFLIDGVDLLGRYDDVLWRYIQQAGYNVPKGDGVP